MRTQFDVMRFPSYPSTPPPAWRRSTTCSTARSRSRFTETITFPVADRPVPDAFHRVLDLLHVVAGVSYYKVGAPPRIEAPRPGPGRGRRTVHRRFTPTGWPSTRTATTCPTCLISWSRCPA